VYPGDGATSVALMEELHFATSSSTAPSVTKSQTMCGWTWQGATHRTVVPNLAGKVRFLVAHKKVCHGTRHLPPQSVGSVSRNRKLL